MSGNNVTLTERDDGALMVRSPGNGSSIIYAAEVAALRERFAAEAHSGLVEMLTRERDELARLVARYEERMPEDVQKLVDEMRRSADSQRRQQPRPGEWAADHGWTARADLLDRAIAALEAAYSQKGAEPEWEYRTLINGGDPFIHRSLTVGSISVAEWFSHDDPRTASGELTLERRRVAGQWEPVEKGADGEPR